MGVSRWPDGKTNSDWYEVAGLVMEMQRETERAISISIMPDINKGQPDLIFEATAVEMDPVNAGQQRSVSTKFRASGMSLASLRGLFTFLLYQLDFALDNSDGAVDSGQ